VNTCIISDGTSTDLKSSNVLFQLVRDMPDWSNEVIHEKLGGLVAARVERYDGQPIGHGAPAKVVEPIATTKFLEADIVDWERVAIVDFGQSYMIGECPTDYTPATAPHYRAPESLFDKQYTSATDVWSLGCLLFEIRAGFPLFDPTWADGTLILVQNVNMLGKLPEPWWTSFTDRSKYFEENGDPKHKKDRTSIRAQLRSVGTWDSPSNQGWHDAPMFEPLGTRLSEHEIELLGDLVSKMVKYRPEERITMDGVVRHPWFSCQPPVVLARYCPEKRVAMEKVMRPPCFTFLTPDISV
jgi:serine/threonine-protein kinase SRPK3